MDEGQLNSRPLFGHRRSLWQPIALAVIGIAVLAFVLQRIDLHNLLHSAAKIGIHRFFILCLWSLCISSLLGAAWWILLPSSDRLPLGAMIWARIVRDSASEILPFSQIGGIIVGARAAVERGLSSPLAAASSIVDVTVETTGQTAFVALGIALAARLVKISAVLTWSIVSLPLLLAVIAVLFTAPKRLELLHTVLSHLSIEGDWITRLNKSLDTIYVSRRRLATALGLHFLAWLASAITVWIVVIWLGLPISFGAALIVEALLSAIRSVSFLVPAALGIQEAAYVVVFVALGAQPETGLLVSLLKRAREAVTGIPALCFWQLLEARQALRENKS